MKHQFLISRERGTLDLILHIVKQQPHLSEPQNKKDLFQVVLEALKTCYLTGQEYGWYVDDAYERIFD